MIALKKEFTGESLKKELNELIQEILTKFDDCSEHKGDRILYKLNFDFSMPYEEDLDILFGILFEKSNLINNLSNKKCSMAIFKFTQILNDLLPYKEEKNLYQLFLNKLNETLDNVQIDHYKFLFALNINLDNSEWNFEEIIPSFNLVKYNIENYKNIKNNKPHKSPPAKFKELQKKHLDLKKKLNIPFKDVLERLNEYNGEIIELSIDARDINIAIDEAKFRIESFLGFLCFINIAFSHTRMYGRNLDIANFGRDYKLCDYGINFFVIIKNDFIYGDMTREDVNQLENRIYTIKDFNFSNELFKIINNHKMFEEICEKFRIYYTASSEDRLDYSFLKFWIVSERILKRNGKMTDRQMLQIINKLHDNNVLKRLSENLISKRNHLVHEGKFDNIYQNDRDLIKNLADIVMKAYLVSMKYVNNNQEFDFLIRNIGRDQSQLKRQIKLLNDIEIHG